MTLAELLVKREPTLTPVQAKEAEQALLRYFEILYQIKNREEGYVKTK